MGKCFLHGNGGGTALNFKVVGNPKPQNPEANTLWVNTDVEIPDWILSATEPDSGDEGAVCIKTGMASNYAFNALKKNGVMVYPLCAMQFRSGKWEYLESQIYQGQWNDLLTEVALFANGILNTDTFGSLVADSGWQSVTISNGIMSFSGYTRTKTTELFDVTAFSSIEYVLTYFNYANLGVALIDEDGNAYELTRSGTQAAGETISFDVSEYVGKYYVKLIGAGNNTSNATKVSSIIFKA